MNTDTSKSTTTYRNADRWQSPPAGMPIPNRLNVAIVAVVAAAAVALLWLASHVGSAWAVLAVGIVYSYVMLTGYALLHEATHGNLHSSPRWNYWLGVAAGLPALFDGDH